MLLAKNRKAFHDYEILETLTAGLVLKGYEVKAIREGKVNFDGSFVQVLSGKPVILNMYIGRYSNQSQPHNEADSRKTRSLLLTSKEVSILIKELSQKGKSAVPLALILSHNLIKLELGIVRGLKKYEKKDIEKVKQMDKDLKVELKSIWH